MAIFILCLSYVRILTIGKREIWEGGGLRVELDRAHLVRRPLFYLWYQPRMIDDECGAVGGMRISRGNWSTQRKPAAVPLCPPQIIHYLTWARTQTAVVRRQRVTAWAMTRPEKEHYSYSLQFLLHFIGFKLRNRSFNTLSRLMTSEPKLYKWHLQNGMQEIYIP
jgi:hypothetical protein